MDDCVYRKAEKAKRAGKELFSLGVGETLPLHVPVGRRLAEHGSWRSVLHFLSVVYPFFFVVLLAVFRSAMKKVQVCSRQTSTTSLGLKTCDAVVFLLASMWRGLPSRLFSCQEALGFRSLALVRRYVGQPLGIVAIFVRLTR